MNKILTKVTALCVGLAMVAGVGVAIGSKSVGKTYAAAPYDFSGDKVTFGSQGLSNETKYSDEFTNNSTFKVKFTGGTNDGKYYTSGSGIRTYGNGSIVVTALSGNLTSIVFTWSGSYAPTADNATPSGYSTSTKTWTGSAASVTLTRPSGSGNWRCQAIQATTSGGSETSHSVKDSVSNGTITPSSVEDGETLTATIAPETWYSVPTSVSVTMGGTSVTHTYSNGVVTVQNVTGDIEISGSCVKTGGPAHAGTLADPYTIADAYMAIDDNAGKDNVYVQGIVSGIVESWSTQYSNISFNISSDGTTTANQLEAFRCVSSSEHPISSDSDIETGATVVVFGSLTKYNSTYEFGAGCKVVSYTAPTSSPLSSISLSGTHATSFDVGDTFSYAGLVVTAHYEDSSSKTVTPTSVSTPDMSSAGQKTVTVSYTENEVSKSAEYTITVNAVTYYEISFLPGEGSGTHTSVQAKEGSDYELPTSTTFTGPEGKVFDYWDLGGEKVTVIENIDDDYEVTAIWKDAPSEVSDELTASIVGVEGTTYTSWTGKSVSSNAVYAGNSSSPTSGATSGSIQLRSSTSSGSTIHSGIVSTTSGGTLVGVQVVWNSGCTAGRVIDVYGKDSAYSTADDLYTSSTQGTKLGSITQGSTTELTGFAACAYVGIRSSNGALNIDSVTFIWEGGSQPEATLTGISVSGAKTDFTVGDAFETTGLVVTAHYEDAADATISTGYEVDSTNVDTTVAGDYIITVSYGGFDDTYIVTYSEPTPVETKTYKKVKTNLANFAGDYLIVYEEGSVAFDGSLENPDVTSNTFAVSITDEAISASEAYEFTVAKKEGGYSLKSASGLYIGKTADSNGMDKNASDNYTNTISYSGTEESDMDIVGSGKPHLRYNASSGQERFRFFKSESYTGQKAVSLYIEVANDAEAFALDILNLTTEVCSAEGEHAAGDFATAWSTLTTKYDSVVNKDLLVGGDADATGTFFAEALARYDILVAKYGLNPFMTGRVSNFSYLPHYESNLDSSSSITIIVIVAVASMTVLGVTLVLRKRKHQ